MTAVGSAAAPTLTFTLNQAEAPRNVVAVTVAMYIAPGARSPRGTSNTAPSTYAVMAVAAAADTFATSLTGSKAHANVTGLPDRSTVPLASRLKLSHKPSRLAPDSTTSGCDGDLGRATPTHDSGVESTPPRTAVTTPGRRVNTPPLPPSPPHFTTVDTRASSTADSGDSNDVASTAKPRLTTRVLALLH